MFQRGGKKKNQWETITEETWAKWKQELSKKKVLFKKLSMIWLFCRVEFNLAPYPRGIPENAWMNSHEITKKTI